MVRMSPRTPGIVCALALLGLLGAGCSSSPKKPASSSTTSTTSAPTTTSPSSTTVTTSPSSTSTTAASVSGACTSAQLSVSIGMSQGAAGTFYYPLVFTNTGSASCTLQGYPGVSLVGTSGNQIGSPAIRTASATPLVSIVPGGTTTATIGLSDALNVCSTPVSPNGFRVYPPNQTAALYAPYSGLEYCVGSSDDTLQVTAVGATAAG
jgi:Protein of unknown function (DUF4232)